MEAGLWSFVVTDRGPTETVPLWSIGNGGPRLWVFYYASENMDAQSVGCNEPGGTFSGRGIGLFTSHPCA